MAFADGDPLVQVSHGTPRDYLVVARLTAGAADDAQAPAGFAVVHLTEASSSGEDRDHDIPLVLEWAENVASATVAVAAAVTCDAVAPTTASPTSATEVGFDVHFDDPVTGFDALADLALEFSGNVAVADATVTGAGQSYAVTLTGVTGDGQVTLAVTTDSDVAGDGGEPFTFSVTSEAVVVDHTAPDCTAVTRPDTSSFSEVDFDVTLSEEVVGLDDAADLIVTTTGETTWTGASVTGSGAAFTVTLTGVEGDGTVALALSTGSDVADLAGNPLAASVTSDPVTIEDPLFADDFESGNTDAWSSTTP